MVLLPGSPSRHGSWHFLSAFFLGRGQDSPHADGSHLLQGSQGEVDLLMIISVFSSFICGQGSNSSGGRSHGSYAQ